MVLIKFNVATLLINILSFLLDEEQTIFLVQTLCKTDIFILQEGLFSLLADHQTLFQGSFVKKRNGMKFPNFDQNHWLILVKKPIMATL